MKTRLIEAWRAFVEDVRYPVEERIAFSMISFGIGLIAGGLVLFATLLGNIPALLIMSGITALLFPASYITAYLMTR